MSALVERDDELASVDALLHDAGANRGRVLVFSAEAGLGKTALLDAASTRACQCGVRVLRAKGGELERGFPHGVLRQLFEPALAGTHAGRATLLAGAAAPAAAVLGGLGREVTTFEIQHGMYWLVSNLADACPLLLIIDDVHWADGPSADCLLYLARRLEELPVALLLAAREGEPGVPEPALQSLLAETNVEIVHVVPISADGTQRLVTERLGDRASLELGAACHEVSAGNPFFLGAVLDELTTGSRPLTPESLPDVRRLGPAAVARSVLLRLARLGPGAVSFAQALAVLEEDLGLERVAVLAGLEREPATAAADALAAAHIIDLEPVRFRHPILRTVIYEDIGQARRAASHREAARLLATRDAEDERAAVHLLAGEASREPWALACLQAAAARAVERAEPGAAAVLLRRALDETATVEERWEVLGRLGRVELDSGDPGGEARLREALELLRDPAERAEAAQTLLWALSHSGRMDEAHAVGRRLRAQAEQQDVDAQQSMELAFLGVAQFDLEASADLTERLESLADRVEPDTPSHRRLLVALAFHRLLWARTSGREVADLAERALAQGALISELPPSDPFVLMVLSVLLQCERDDLVERQVAVAHAQAARHGSATGLGVAHTVSSRLALFRGDLRQAEEEALEAMRLNELTGAWGNHPFAVSTCLTVHLHRGELDAAQRLLAAHDLSAGLPRGELSHWTLLHERSALRRAQGRLDEALVDGRAALAMRESRAGVGLLARGSVALAAHAAGDADEAGRLADADLEVARGWGVPSTLGMALRVAGIVRPVPDGIELLAAAVEQLAGSPRRLEHARALIDLGSALRRANQRAAAGDPLRDGMDLAARCGATGLAERARDELMACGGRPRRLVRWGVDALTASERRVASLAASGKTNREIAQALFVTRKTVESHLRAVYRKLDVNSREDLGQVLAKDQDPPPDARAAEPAQALGG